MSDIERYDYNLPPELIAQQPLATRSDARMLVVDRKTGTLSHAYVRDLSDWLEAGDCLVVNDSRVIPARLVGYRTDTGGRWSGLFLSSDDEGNWRLLAKTRSKMKPGATVTLLNRQGQDDVRLRMLTSLDQGEWAARPETDEAATTLLERVGRVPLPHYIRDGEMLPEDLESYQTVYATEPGSVAAPTAGLHFTEKLLARLREAGIDLCPVTLHVGLGTFRPIAAENLEQHHMHSEWVRLDTAAVQCLSRARESGKRIVAVGTTSVRVLESAAASGHLSPWTGTTELFIRPPFTFRAVDALLTNFHLPRSTLLVLVRTFGGDRLIRQAYDEAISQRYRFYSYGDAMLVL
jgi:S-adenosylmethionine:tRNA ribosyltransferase-isomerase